MVQLMRSDSDNNHFYKKVKLESQQQDDVPNKRPKFDFNLDSSPKCDSSGDDSVQASQSLYNPLDEPSPLGLRLKKSPSLLDLIQMRLSQQHDSKKKDHKASAASAADSKLKASNFPATVLKIGTWEYKSRYEGDLVAKCYFAKHKLVWEVLDGCLKNKIEIPWSDIMALKANYPDDAPGTLEVVLARRPLFFREINPQPRKHTLWQATSDFTGGEAGKNRRHFIQCPQGLLGRHFEKLIQCDPRLNFLSQQQDFVLDSPYFEPGTALHDHIESSDGYDRKSEGQAGIFGLNDVESGSAVQSSSSRSEHNLMGKAVENNFQEITSPSSVMNPHAIKGFKSRGPESLKFLSNLNQIKLPGLHPSMSMDDLVNHIGNCISEQMGPESSNFASDRSMLEEFTQYLFNDSQFPPTSDEQQPASDEQYVMSRVNSLYSLLQKDPPAAKQPVQNGLNAMEDRKVGESNSAECKSKMVAFEIQQDDDDNDDYSGSQQENGLSRQESAGDLLLNLPRIASMPHFLFPMPEDSGSHVR
ncbi:hypothetical protein P8452_29874 [Trifolium repens]|nr:hypothetical protein P8452_29874 [Trifolium repens]